MGRYADCTTQNQRVISGVANTYPLDLVIEPIARRRELIGG